jgi:hypothetical protein
MADTLYSALATKTTPVAADKLLGTDSADGSSKNFTLTGIQTTLVDRTQAGSTASGTPLRLMTITPASAGASKFVFEIGGANFGGVEDSVSYFGWNTRSGGNRIDTARSRIGINFEDQYNDGGIDTTEAYIEFQDTSGSYIVRPFMFQFRRSPSGYSDALRQSYFRGNPIIFQLADGTTSIADFADGAANIRGTTNVALALIPTSGTASLNLGTSGTPWMTVDASGVTAGAIKMGGTTVMAFSKNGTLPQATVGSNAPWGLFTADLTNLSSAGNPAITTVARNPVVSGQSHYEAHDASHNILSRFDNNGYFMTRKTAAPADAALASGEMAIWFDSTNGAAKLMVKAKQADGTVRTGSVALA